MQPFQALAVCLRNSKQKHPKTKLISSFSWLIMTLLPISVGALVNVLFFLEFIIVSGSKNDDPIRNPCERYDLFEFIRLKVFLWLVSTFLSAVFVIIAAFYFNFFLKWSEKIIYLGFGKLSLVFFKKLVDVQSEIAENLGSRNSTMPYITWNMLVFFNFMCFFLNKRLYLLMQKW